MNHTKYDKSAQDSLLGEREEQTSGTAIVVMSIFLALFCIQFLMAIAEAVDKL